MSYVLPKFLSIELNLEFTITGIGRIMLTDGYPVFMKVEHREWAKVATSPPILYSFVTNVIPSDLECTTKETQLIVTCSRPHAQGNYGNLSFRSPRFQDGVSKHHG